MKVSCTLAVLATLAVSLAACTGRSPRPVQIENQPKPEAGTTDPRTGLPTDPDKPAESQNPGSQNPGNPDPGTANPEDVDANVELTQQYLQSKVASIDLSNLTYKFAYLTKTQADKITFDTQGKTTLTFRALPANQSGTITLEILEAGTVKLSGKADNVLLKTGVPNKIALDLQPVDNGGGTGGDTTDLIIDVSLGGTGGGGGGTGGGGTGGGNTDPVANWDGKSNQGNARWKIVPVDG